MTGISRVTRSKESAKASYNRMSKGYDLLAGESEKKYKDIGLQFLSVQPGETVLEIGFGTGKALVPLAHSVGVTGKAVGLDISEGMLECARENAAKRGISNIQTKLCDVSALPYEDNTFDVVYSLVCVPGPVLRGRAGFPML